MLLYLFPEQFSPDVVLANYRYYEPRTDHGSSLSPPIHAAIAARLGLRADAERYWRQSLSLDLSNTMGNSSLGVHANIHAMTMDSVIDDACISVLPAVLATRRLRYSGEPRGGNFVTTDLADAVHPPRHSIQRDVDIHKLAHCRLANGLQRIIVLQLDGPVVSVVAEWLQLPRQILPDPLSPLLQLGSPNEQTGAYLFKRFGIGGHGTPVLAFSN
jgi:hypothetical protein